jgi:cytosine/uracil/thiamine/allantoin permease
VQLSIHCLRLFQGSWQQFWPLLTACVGFWGTLALNIADFTRCASSLGFALGSLGRSAGVS